MTVNIVTPDNLERFAEGSKEKFARASHTHSNATTSKAGFMSAEDKQNLDTLVQDGTLLSPATTDKLGGVKVGANLSVTADGTLSADAQQYTLPTASADTLGGVKVGTNLSISNGVLSATNTDTKVTSVGNHYTPSADTNSALTSTASSTGTYALNTEYNVVTGITLSRDAKGHVTGISTTNQKVKDTNTTYSAGTTAQLTTGTDTANRVWPAKQIADYVKGKADKAITSITRSDTTFTYTCVDGTTGTFTQQDNNTTYGNFVKSGSGAASGLVPAPSTTAGTTKYLREDGTWQVPPDTNTTYSSKTAASGGTDVSLVTTGEKYTWNNKSNLAIGTSATTAAAGNHTHTTSLATDSDTATVRLAQNTIYKLTAGGTSVIFKTPMDTKNTAGSTNSTSKLFLVGAPSQTANPKTYSHSDVYATAGALVAVSFQATSDRRKKTNIKELGDLDLSGIKSYNYTLKSNNEQRTGLIAQEVMYVIPDAVKADGRGYLSLDYNAVVAVLVAKVNKLESRIKELENK